MIGGFIYINGSRQLPGKSLLIINSDAILFEHSVYNRFALGGRQRSRVDFQLLTRRVGKYPPQRNRNYLNYLVRSRSLDCLFLSQNRSGYSSTRLNYNAFHTVLAGQKLTAKN